jgi:hypothetical protein
MSSHITTMTASYADDSDFHDLDASNESLGDFLSQFGDYVVGGNAGVQMVRPIGDDEVRRHKSWFIYW